MFSKKGKGIAGAGSKKEKKAGGTGGSKKDAKGSVPSERGGRCDSCGRGSSYDYIILDCNHQVCEFCLGLPDRPLQDDFSRCHTCKRALNRVEIRHINGYYFQERWSWDEEARERNERFPIGEDNGRVRGSEWEFR